MKEIISFAQGFSKGLNRRSSKIKRKKKVKRKKVRLGSIEYEY